MRLACWQVAAWPEEDGQRLTRLAATAARARDAGADLLVTPELSLTGYQLEPARVRRAADRAGELLDRVAAIAVDHRLPIVCGFAERVGDRVYNAVRIVGTDGAPVVAYRKTHLWGEPERAVFDTGSTGVVQARIADTTVGLLICYDVEFPEAVRAHARAGTELLVVPAALVGRWSIVAELLVPARAFESQLYVAYINWSEPTRPAEFRSSGPGNDAGFCGLTRMVDPHGRISTAPGTGEDLLLADIERAEIEAARESAPYLVDLRSHLYAARAD